MNPDEIVVAMTLVLVLAYGGSQALTWWRKRTQHPVPMARRAARTNRPRSYQRRSAYERNQELRWIKSGLEAGIDPRFMARSLKGNPAYNRRRVRAVAAILEAANAKPPDEETPVCLETHHASVQE